MRQLGAWKPTGRLLLGCYIVGFAVCYASLALFFRQKGPVIYVNLLLGLLWPLREWFRQFGPPASMVVSTGSQVISAALGGLLFPAIVALLRYEQRFLRGLAFLLGVVLIIMCLWWSQLPNI